MMFTGPFTLAPGDTQWMMTALIPELGSDRFESIRLLRQSAARLRAMPYDSIARPRQLESPRLPPTPVLFQNFPNPFNSSTIIRYSLSSESDVSLQVYNLLGQKVRTLVEGGQTIGYHEVRFDGSSLASGVYFYRLQVRSLGSVTGRDSGSGAGNFVETRKLLLIR